MSCINPSLDASVPTRVSVFPGFPHGFRRWGDLLASKAFDARVLDSIRWSMGLGGCKTAEMEEWYEYQTQMD